MISADDDLDMKNRIREELLEKCGIIITIFGKNESTAPTELLEADGTYIEYNMAKENGIIVIPVGATGFTSEAIYRQEEDKWRENKAIYSILGDREVDNSILIENIIKGIEFKKRKHEEDMRELLMKNFFEDTEKKELVKKIFLSFHYKSCFKYADKVIDIIEKSTQYTVSKEFEKCEDEQIQKWIDEKMKDSAAIIILFNQDFLNSEWTDYEVKKGVKIQIPFLLLINEKDPSFSEIEKYIKKKEIKKYSILSWKTEKDFDKIPSALDKLLTKSKV